MKGRWLWLWIGINLLAIIALAFVYPHLMVAPGPLAIGHETLATDCFACHTPTRGASADRCVACHSLPNIGLRTTMGAPVETVLHEGASRLKKSFHQELTEQNCMACHSDHAGPKLTKQSRKKFSHELLRTQTRSQCESCHAAPSNAMHQKLGAECAQCHSTEAWKPATFAHEKLFLLDKDHNASCATCHLADDYSKYTCYGCHEHTPDKVRSKHSKEGIQNFDNCVECHRSAHGESDGRGSGDNKGTRQRDKHD